LKDGVVWAGITVHYAFLAIGQGVVGRGLVQGAEHLPAERVRSGCSLA
jgi:hypothetical protein